MPTTTPLRNLVCFPGRRWSTDDVADHLLDEWRAAAAAAQAAIDALTYATWARRDAELRRPFLRGEWLEARAAEEDARLVAKAAEQRLDAADRAIWCLPIVRAARAECYGGARVADAAGSTMPRRMLPSGDTVPRAIEPRLRA